ncbi:ABC transporter ATP-binding protein [Anaerocolumna cellulosilytica]|uniref:ABC transporter ATP-binding protein n=1 Tax=Anaerocolumna cellulosilytica TaxID=433286 RepID=A0A6S6R3P7_9FIRM|nr:ABC transporter ATP-binding protein [Anaerocolumna cellulosilytica]MBB5195510.1 ATP-binding cassette subfamily B protein [Anaerocolumna cellulosilytica]BCJ93751.1 ABC transporter ATP-binding protein [Anaerocolumna cellulosilytica]
MKAINNCYSFIIKSVKEVFTVSKGLFLTIYLVAFIQGILNSFPIILMQVLFDQIEKISSSQISVYSVLRTIFIMFVVKCIIQVMADLGNFLYEYHHMKVIHKLTNRLNNHIGLINAISFEDKELLDQIEKAYQGTGQVRKLVDTVLMLLLNYLPSLIVVGAYLYKAKPVLIIILLLIFLPVLISEISKAKLFTDLEDELAPLNRKIQTYNDYLIGRKFFKETRLLGTFQFFLKRLNEAIKIRNEAMWKITFITDIRELGTKFLSLGGYISILIILYISVLKKEISIGYFAAIFTSLDSLFFMMEEIVSSLVGGVAQVTGKIKNYFKFREVTPLTKEGISLKYHDSIILENVCFSYPNSSNIALHNVNLKVGRGESIAVVGENGSGKTTLVRLLAGIYSPTDGKIFYNGVESNKYNPFELFYNTSAVFQNYGKYDLSLEDNIKISNLDSDKNVDFILNDLEMEIPKGIYPEGIKTMLSREFGGIDLSGGQWQKIAIARGGYRDKDLLLLDEPTSAIDPIEEAVLYTKFQKLIRGRMSFIVTHRLGAARISDKIIVMKKGKIVGIGKHMELLNTCDEYKKMWLAQSEQYT